MYPISSTTRRSFLAVAPCCISAPLTRERKSSVCGLRAVLGPIPDARFVVSGEVLFPEVAGYLAAGARGSLATPASLGRQRPA
jgi:hypothetical protein